MELSEDAYVIGLVHFTRTGSTLSFGGDHARMEITPRARAALDELIAGGFVEAFEALDGCEGREHYRAVKSVLPLSEDRPHLHHFELVAEGAFNWLTFREKKPPTLGEAT